MDMPVLPRGMLELDDDIARGANSSVRGGALWMVRRRTVPAAAHARLLDVTLSAHAGVITGDIGEREIVAARLCDGTTAVAARVLRGGRGC
jgi:hypothetical protein